MSPAISLQRILHATDFRERSKVALEYAAAFAERFQATLVLIHAIELSEAAEEAEAGSPLPSASRKVIQGRLEELAEGVRRRGITVETHVSEGPSADIVCAACDLYRCDLLVMGIHGVHHGVDHLIVGSNTEKILLSAGCPVFTIGAQVPADAGLDPRVPEVLYFSDLSTEAAAAAPYAAFFGRAFRAPVEVCELRPEGADSGDDRIRQRIDRCGEEIRSALAGDASAGDAPGGSLPTVPLQHGKAVQRTLERAQTQHAGLIVLGVHPETGFGRYLHTSYAYRLLARATCPVLSARMPHIAS